jgi:alpha-N-arabinofuranosidase
MKVRPGHRFHFVVIGDTTANFEALRICSQGLKNVRTVLPRTLLYVAFCLLITTAFRADSQSAPVKLTISSEPLPNGKVDPKLFGNFVELLEDVVPGMWAEMLNDRSFEGITPCANWSYYDGSPTFCDRQWDTNSTCSFDTTKPFNGSRSAKLSAHRTATLTQSGLAVNSGMTYDFSGYFRTDNPRVKLQIILRAPLPSGGWTTLASAKLSSPTTRWEKCRATLKSKGTTDRAVFELRVEGDGNLWADKLSLMPENNKNGWRADVVQAIRDVKPALIRWGGSVCDPGQYRWKEGIGNRDFRTPFRNKVWGRIDSNDVGIDEFCQFCELVDAEPLVCISFADGAQSAADLVEYCNGSTTTPWGKKRAANGHAAPYRIKYWQIGNEISGDEPQYLAQFKDFVTAIRKSDPTAKILSSFPSQKLLQLAGKQIDYVAPHHYTTDLAACDREFNNLADLFKSTPDCAHIQIAVTEWNTSAGDWGIGRAKQMTLGAALANARYLNLLIRHSDRVKIACRSNLANSFCGAIIETNPEAVLKRASYYVMQLYATHQLPIPLRVQSNGDVDVCACASEDRNTVVAFVVNSKTEPIHCNIAFDGLRVSPKWISVLADRLDARQTDVMNHWNVPERVTTMTSAVTGNEITLPALSVCAIECKP